VAVSFEADLSEPDRLQLAGILNTDLAHLDELLAPYAQAALTEYVRMILGQRIFRRGDEILEYRLLLMIKSIFGGLLPEEQQVSALFQRSPTQSRSLIRAVCSKYQYDLSQEIAASMRAALESVEDDPAGWSFNTNSIHIVESMNLYLQLIEGSMQAVTKVRGTVSNYLLVPSSYEALCHKLGLTPKTKP
jgi:hypothetical protein